MGLSAEYIQRPAAEETINDPTNPKHYWRYRMHVTVEDLRADRQLLGDLQVTLCADLRSAVWGSQSVSPGLRWVITLAVIDEVSGRGFTVPPLLHGSDPHTQQPDVFDPHTEQPDVFRHIPVAVAFAIEGSLHEVWQRCLPVSRTLQLTLWVGARRIC